MSYKHHTQQKRRKWAEQGATFTPRFVARVVSLERDPDALPALRALAKELHRFSLIQFTFGEVEDLKEVLAVFQAEMARGGFQDRTEEAVSLLLEVVFADNSRPLHRGVLAALKKLPNPEHQEAVAAALQQRIRQDACDYLNSQREQAAEQEPNTNTNSAATQYPVEQGSDTPPPTTATQGPAQAGTSSKGAARVILGQTLASLLWLPSFQDWVRPVAVQAVQAVASSTHHVMRCANAQQHVAPSLMNEIQDAISSLYYIIQKHGQEMAASPDGCAALVAASNAMIYALQGHVLVREAMASAAVVVWVAALCPGIPPQHVAAQFAQGLFLTPTQLAGGATVTPLTQKTSTGTADQGGEAQGPPDAVLSSNGNTSVTQGGAAGGLVVGPVEEALLAQGSSLAVEISRFSPVGKVCALKGLVTAIPAPAMCSPMAIITPGAPAGAGTAPHDTFTFLVEGALQYGCQQVQIAPDGHFKFHAACVTHTCMAQLLELWRAHRSHSAEDTAAALEPPRLRQEAVTAILDMLWANLDEPLAQTLRQLQGIFDMLLELLALQHQHPATTPTPTAGGQGGSTTPKPQPGVDDPLLEQVASQLVAVSPMRKGRYARLSSLVTHLGAQRLLALHPALIQESLHVLQEDIVSSTASTFLKVLLQELRQECRQQPVFCTPTSSPPAPGHTAPGPGPQQQLQQGVVEGAAVLAGDERDEEARRALVACAAWQSWWLPDLLTALTSDNERLRYHVSVHALPVVLALEPTSLVTIIHHITGAATSSSASTAAPAGAPPPPPLGPHLASPVQGGRQVTAALVSLLRASRQLQLVADLDSLTHCKKALGMDVEQVLLAAVVHPSESVRVDCLELVATNPKATEPPGQLELKVVARWLASCLRATSQGQRNRCIALINRLMSRLQVAVQSCHARVTAQASGAVGGRWAGAHKGKGSAVHHVVVGLARDDEGEEASGLDGASADSGDSPEASLCADTLALAHMQRFCQWVNRTMLGCLYPGAPFERKYLAVEVLNAMLAMWPVNGAQPANSKYHFVSKAVPAFDPYCATFHTPEVIQLLLANAIDSWDKLRQSATNVLLRLPTPWPGVESGGALLPLLTWAYQLLCSARLREADAGARMLKLIFAKYTCGLSWHITLGATINVDDRRGAVTPAAAAGVPGAGPAAAAAGGAAAGGGGGGGLFDATHTFLSSLLDLVEGQCQLASQGDAGLLAACCTSFVHGPLLLLRYVAEDVKWSALAASSPAVAAALQRWVARALDLLGRAARLAVPPLAGAGVGAGVGAGDVDAGDMDGEGGEGGDGDGEDGEGAGDAGPEAQVITTGCWLSVKEVALAGGTLAHCLPLDEQGAAGEEAEGKAGAAGEGDGAVGGGVGALLDAWQTRRLGQLLVVEIMLVAKHTGALHKAGMGLTTLAGKLLRSTNLAMSCQPQALLAECMKKLVSPGQGLDDIVRRSAGLPLAIGALLRAEPANTPKVMLARTMAQVLAVAQHGAPALWTVAGHITGVQGLGLTPAAGDGQGSNGPADAAAVATSQPPGTGDHGAGAGAGQGGSAAVGKEEEEGSVQRWPTAGASEAWPRVHAYNVLRHLVSDSQLAVDTSGYNAAALQACISSLSDPAWEVRNAATLCFTALVVRVLGFKNVGKWESPRKAITGGEFFSRFPGLHTFLLDQLGQAVNLLEQDATGPSPTQSLPRLHPSLFPVLLLLSRLRPGPPLEAKNAPSSPALSPELFAPLVRRCAAARHYAVRQLAARALAPLVPAEQAVQALLSLLPRLPASNAPAARQARTIAAAAAASHAGPTAVSVLDGPGAAAGRRLSSNELQGLLMQLEALLRHNVLPGHVNQVLALVAPHLVALLTAWHPRATATAPPPAACHTVLLRACHATLSLMQPHHCHTHVTLLQSVTDQCSILVAATASHSHQQPLVQGFDQATGPVDFADPMRSSMLKEAALLWVGLATMCSTCAHVPHVVAAPAHNGRGLNGPVSSSSHEGLCGTLLVRLQQCLGSPALDVRAAGAKAAAGLLAALADRLCCQSPELGLSGLKASSPVGSASSVQADQDRWAHLLLPSQAGQGDLASQAQHLADLCWDHLRGEPLYKVRKRLLRVLHAAHALAAHATTAAGTTASGSAAGAANSNAATPQLPAGVGGDGRGSMAQVTAVLAGACGVEERAEALRCLGQGLHSRAERQRQGEGADDAGAWGAALDAFCDELEGSTAPTQPDEVRLAAADALAASGLLSWTPASQDQQQDSSQQLWQSAALRCWLVGLTLSEDEDERVREVATSVMQGAGGGGSQQQLHTEGVQRATVALLPERFTGCVHLPASLCSLVVRPHERALPELLRLMAVTAATPTPLAVIAGQQGESHAAAAPLATAGAEGNPSGAVEAGSGSVNAGAVGMAGRIFDAELDNQHEEPLFIAQLAAQQLRVMCEAAASTAGHNSGSSTGSQPAGAGPAPIGSGAQGASSSSSTAEGCSSAGGLHEACLGPVSSAAAELRVVVEALTQGGAGRSGADAGGGGGMQQVLQQPTVMPYVYCRLLLIWATAPVFPSSPGQASLGSQRESGVVVLGAGMAQDIIQRVSTTGADTGPLAAVVGPLLRWCGGAGGEAGGVGARTDQVAGWHGLGPLFLTDDGSRCMEGA